MAFGYVLQEADNKPERLDSTQPWVQPVDVGAMHNKPGQLAQG